MIKKHTIFSLGILLFSLNMQNVTAQSSNATNFEVTAVFVEEAPQIDGYINDDIWKKIQPITNFTQVWPNDGSPATEETEVRIAYDRDNLYFAFKFYDKNPELIRAKNLERGGRNDRDDHAYIGIDTYQDGRNAYLFEMNALGTQDDATITDERLSIDSFSWDAVFRSETVINDDGWTLEVSIPFRQLRFPEGDELEFGLMLSRTINRKNERVLWPAIGLEYGNFTSLAAVSQYGTLKGLKNIRRGKNLEIKPYVITGAQEIRPDIEFEETNIDYTKDLGVDVKYGISSNLTLDMTINTDFAQVESDNVQLNLTRFNLFFPEKREFFLERSGLFEHGNLRSTQTFFSRRIGLRNQILAGARMTGQIGEWSIGALNIETGDEMRDFLGSNSQNNTVIRLRNNFMPRATAGVIFTNLEQNNSYNRALGFDTQYRFGSSSLFNAWFTNVWDDLSALNDAAGHASLRIRNDLYNGQISYTNVGTNYSPALGFVRRRDMRQYNLRAGYTPSVDFEALPSLNRMGFNAVYDYIEGQDGQKQTTELEFETTMDFSTRDRLTFEFERNFDRLQSPFDITEDATIPAGDYTFNVYEINGETDSSRRLFLMGGFSFGDFYNGKRTDYSGGFGFRQSQHLTLEGNFQYSKIDLPVNNGEFDATTLSMSVLGAFSRKLFTKTLIQYDNFSRDLQANIRVDWIHTPGSDLFFVYNTSYHITGANENTFNPRRDFIMNDQIAILKLTYLIML
ncbi:carbohydrate binding family 9 domain-containing protein [Balneola vulgaris]|uniref:carbohydrate binding family 9 domain-containing protein n=1 Tax=Balneola vulgaris TaxID=287535 RepID=UPI00035CF160|nr:carbohydrate binding family 9 domain-containing protein [Balneola vulgaris]